jgi:zinc protease
MRFLERATLATLTAALACAPVAVPTTPPVAAAATSFDVAGIPVIFKPVTANDVVAVSLFLKGGSANLSAQNAGIESLIGLVAPKGTEKYDKDAFTALATRTGTSVGGSATFDFSVLQAQGVRQHWDTMWDLFTQAALHPTFPEQEVATARGQLLNSLRQQTDNPDQYLSLLGDSVVYGGHAYAILPQGTVASVTGLTRGALVSWHRERLSKENLLLVVAGNVSRADLEAKVAQAFGSLPARGGAAVALPPATALTPDVVVVTRQIPTNYIAGYYAAPAPSHPDYAAFRVATSILSDRLFEEVRTKRNLSYAANARLFDRRANVGRIYVTAVAPDTAVRVMLAEVQRMQREPVAADLLAEKISVLLTQYWMAQETNSSQAMQLGFWELSGGGWRNAFDLPARLRAVTPADVQQAAQRYLRNARFVVIGDPAKIQRELFTSM